MLNAIDLVWSKMTVQKMLNDCVPVGVPPGAFDLALYLPDESRPAVGSGAAPEVREKVSGRDRVAAGICGR